MQRRPLPSIVVPDTAGSIRATSAAILSRCLSCPTGVQPFVPLASPMIRAHGDVLELDALCRQHALLTRQFAVSASAAPAVGPDAYTDAELPQVIAKLEGSIHSAQAQLERISLVAQRLCMTSDLSKAVLSSQQTPLEQSVTHALQQRDVASQRFLRLHQQGLELRAEVASLESESNALRQQNRRLAARIIQLQPSLEVARQDVPQETQRLQQSVESLTQQCSILHSVVLNLIIESGVNWNRDERLFALFMMDPKNLAAATAAVPSK